MGAFTWKTAAAGLVFLLNSVLNTLIVIVVPKCSLLHTPSARRLIIYQAVTDLLNGTVVAVIAYSSYAQRWEIGGEIGCIICGILLNSFSIVNMHVVALISLERYLAICHPLRYEQLVNVKKFDRTVFGIVLVDVLLSLLGCLVDGKYPEYRSDVYICVPPFRTDWVATLISTSAILPTIGIMIFCNVKILLAIRHQQRQICALGTERRQRKGEWICLVLCSFFVIAYAPLFFNEYIIKQYYVNDTMSFCFVLFSYCSGLGNFVIFSIMNTSFWNKLKSMCTCSCR